MNVRILILFGLLVSAGCQTTKVSPPAAPEFVRIRSILFDAAKYDPMSSELALLTKDGGLIVYKGVPPKVYHRFMATPGKAGYWEANIYKRFNTRVDKFEEKPSEVVAVKISMAAPHRLMPSGPVATR